MTTMSGERAGDVDLSSTETLEAGDGETTADAVVATGASFCKAHDSGLPCGGELPYRGARRRAGLSCFGARRLVMACRPRQIA